jgi:hypothetical protein
LPCAEEHARQRKKFSYLVYEFLCRAPSLTRGKGPLPCVC